NEVQFGTKTANRKYFPGEEYWLSITAECVVVLGASPRGTFYGVQTLLQILRQVPPAQVPCLIVHDWPVLELRGAHVDLKGQYQSVDYYKSLFNRFAEWKLNTVLIELEDKLPFQEHAEAVSPNALFSPLLEELLAEADRLFLEVIPLHQSMSHLRWLLSDAAYERLVENPRGTELELCPSNPAALTLSKKLYDEVCAVFPGRFIHVGGSEHFSLGVCPQCAKFVNGHPKGADYARGELYGKFLAEIARYIRAKGKIPFAWSDMTLTIPYILDFLQQGTLVFLYWDYDVTKQFPSGVSDYDPEFNQRTPSGDRLDWVRVGDQKYSASELESIPVHLRGQFGSYILPDAVGFFRAYPYYRFFRDKHFEVIAGPATQCCVRAPDIPQYSQHHPNLRLHGRIAANEGALGYITTNWVTYGAPPECSIYGFALGAEAAWHPDAPKSILGFYRRFGVVYYGITDERWVAIVPRLGTAFYPKRDQYWAEVTADAGKILEEISQQVTRNALSFGFLRWAYFYRSLEYNISRVLHTVETAIISIDGGKRVPLSEDERGAFLDDLLSLIDQISIIQDATAALFRITYHPAEVEDELERRFAQKLDTLEQFADLLEDYPETHDRLVEILIAQRTTPNGFI
ncbi:MAG: glycoside hydrolase, partial [Promethearchaeota archaeon CR_4]